MATDFNELADTYHHTKENLLKRYSEEPTLLAAAGDLAGLDVLDLACGNGHYTRMLKRAGAARVVGVDLAETMIAGALEAEAAEPLGINYLVRDVAALPADLGQFDLITATYLFHYAPTQAALNAMIASIAARLRPGGRLVSVGMSPSLDSAELEPLARYGAQISAETPLGDGDPINVAIETPVGPITFQCFHWTWAAYTEALQAAGLSAPERYPLIVSDAGQEAFGTAFWQAHLEHPSLAVFIARR